MIDVHCLFASQCSLNAADTAAKGGRGDSRSSSCSIA